MTTLVINQVSCFLVPDHVSVVMLHWGLFLSMLLGFAILLVDYHLAVDRTLVHQHSEFDHAGISNSDTKYS